MRKGEKKFKKLRKMILQIIMLQVLLVGILAGCGNVPENEEEDIVQADETFRMPEVPILTIETASADCYDVNGKLNAQMTYDIVSLDGNGFETVAQSILEWNEQDIGKLMKMGKEYTGDRRYTANFQSDVMCTRMDSSVISLQQQCHGTDISRHYLGVNFDVASGKRLVLADILEDEERFKDKAIKSIIEKLQEVLDTDIFQGYEADAGQEWISEYIDINSMWYLDAVGIVFFFNPSGSDSYI